MKKLLQVCFIAAMVFGLASCEKDNDSSNGNGTNINTQNSLVGTTWGYNDGEAEIRVLFETTMVKVSVQTPHGNEYYEGTYTYNNGSGTIALVEGEQTLNITFTVSGNTMNAYNTPAGNVTLTLIGSNPQPQPSGSYPLNGTTWECSEGEGQDYEMYQITFGTTNCHLVISSVRHGNQQDEGTYSYDGTTATSGRGTITLNSGKGGTFVVNGQEATVTADNRSMIFVRVSK